MLPSSDKLSICFAHVAYRLHERFSTLGTGIGGFAVRDPATLEKRIGDADVLVISGLWRNSLLDRAGRLRFDRHRGEQAAGGGRACAKRRSVEHHGKRGGTETG